MNIHLPQPLWKTLVAAACLAVLALCWHEAQGYLALSQIGQGKLGVTFVGMVETPVGSVSHLWEVDSVEEGSPAAKLLAPGDIVRFVDPLDPWCRHGINKTILLERVEGKTSQSLPIPLIPERGLRADAADAVARLGLTVLALAFCLLIAFKAQAQPGYRLLALCFLALSLNLFITFNYTRDDTWLRVGKLANLAAYPLSWYLCASFFLQYRYYPRTPLRVWLQRVFSVYRPLAFACAAYALWYGSGHEAPGLDALTLGVVGGGLLLTLASLTDGVGQSSGELRQRHRWLLLSVGLGAIPSMLAMIPSLDATGPWGLRRMAIACYVGMFLMYVGFVYAVLRHRVFNFKFALGRVLLFSVASTLLICSVGLAEWIATPELKTTLHAKEIHIAEAVLALGVYLVFHLLHSRGEHHIERVLFRRWHDNEHALREFVRRAAHITDQRTLIASLADALDRFTKGAGAAVYLPGPEECFRLASATLAGAPDAFKLATLERDKYSLGTMLPCLPSSCGFRHDQMAVPMSHRGRLNGLVVLGMRADGEPYRPDECKAISFAAQQVGIDLDTLRIEELERRMAALRADVHAQETALRLLAGRRAAVRAEAARVALEASAVAHATAER